MRYLGADRVVSNRLAVKGNKLYVALPTPGTVHQQYPQASGPPASPRSRCSLNLHCHRPAWSMAAIDLSKIDAHRQQLDANRDRGHIEGAQHKIALIAMPNPSGTDLSIKENRTYTRSSVTRRMATEYVPAPHHGIAKPLHPMNTTGPDSLAVLDNFYDQEGLMGLTTCGRTPHFRDDPYNTWQQSDRGKSASTTLGRGENGYPRAKARFVYQ